MQNNVGHTDKLLRIGAAVILLGLGVYVVSALL